MNTMTLIGVPPAVLQIVALWCLLLAALLNDAAPPGVERPSVVGPINEEDGCPFCGAPFEVAAHRGCWCGSDGHWF